jgi:hypothetical protein
MTVLHIFNDENTAGDRVALDRSFGAAHGRVVRWGCPSVAHFVHVLNHHLAAKDRFDRVVIDTHGGPGLISFGRGDVDIGFWLRSAARIQTGLCAPGGVVYFSGCNVAEGQDGWGFLEGAAAFWLKGAGGRVSGWTSVGLADIIFSTGRVWHPSGRHRTLWADQNGRYLRRAEG